MLTPQFTVSISKPLTFSLFSLSLSLFCQSTGRVLSINPAACHVLNFLRYVPTEDVANSRQLQQTFGVRSLETIGLLVESLEDLESVRPILASLGRRHICPRRLKGELKVSLIIIMHMCSEWQLRAGYLAATNKGLTVFL